MKLRYPGCIERGMILAISGGAAAHAQTPPIAWTHQIGTSATDAAYGACQDGAGGMCFAGTTGGALAAPNPNGAIEVLLGRYDGSGSQLWARQFGTGFGDWAYSTCLDAQGILWVGGDTYGNLGGTYAGGVDGWLAKYDLNGNRAWIRQFGTAGDEYVYAVAPDGAGGCFICGSTTGSLGGTSSGGEDAYLARYDAAGNRTWMIQFGTPGMEEAWGLQADGAGGVWVTGFTTGSLGGATAGGKDAFLGHFNSSGGQVSLSQFGTGFDDVGLHLAADGSGGFFLSGTTFGAMGGTSFGDRDVFLARYDSNGTQLWIRQFGTWTTDWGQALCSDGSGGVFVGGNTLGDFGSQNHGNYDLYVAQYDGNGNRAWVAQFGTSYAETLGGLASDGAGGVLLAGATQGSLWGTNPNPGVYDIVLGRLGNVACYANCDSSTASPFLNVGDFTCFLQKFATGAPYANCDGSSTVPVLNVGDFTCFLQKFALGCSAP